MFPRRTDLVSCEEDPNLSLSCLEVGEHSSDNQDNEDNSGSDDDTPRRLRRRFHQENRAVAISFRDVEGSIKPFDGTKKYPVERWINDFENFVKLLGWSELQAFIFAKKSLTGVAKLFVDSEDGLTSWKLLRRALRKEFSSNLNSAELHKLLSERRMKPNEDVYAYFLEMKELASRGHLEEEALFHYVINGIHGDEYLKSILYGATNVSEFKSKLRIYEEVLTKSVTKQTLTARSSNSNMKQLNANHPQAISVSRCYSCGIKGHKANECQRRGEGLKCFRCNLFGHIGRNCPQNNNLQTQQESSNRTRDQRQGASINQLATSNLKHVCKTIYFSNVAVEALIDTGSQINLVRQSVLNSLGEDVYLKHSPIQLFGIAGSQAEATKYFEHEVTIDDESFFTKFYIVPDKVLSFNVILGSELLGATELVINKDGVKISKIDDVMEEEASAEAAIMQIEVERIESVNIGPTGEEMKSRVVSLLNNYAPRKTKTTNVQMKICVKNDEPVHHRPRRLPFAERDIVNAQVQEWLYNGVIEPSTSEWSSQVVVARKKDGSPRICIDYRKVNKIIMKDRYPLPLIEDQLDKLSNATIYSTLDLKNGFFHVSVEPSSRKYTSFVTCNGQYQFKRVPFGLCNSPSVFQKFINQTFQPLINAGLVLPYMDDLIIPAADEDEAFSRLQKVLETCAEYGLEINKKKCHLLKRRIEFLGHVIEDGKVYPSELKTRAVLKFPTPTSIKQVQSFLGLTGYFRKFIPNYAKIAKPLSDLLRKDSKFVFAMNESNAFNQLKQVMTQGPVLNIFRQGTDTELHTDASKFGYGAILLQRSTEDNAMHPIYYMSRKTSEAEQKYCSYELEVLAIIQALQKFRVYLLGSRFKIVTDCDAFTKTMYKKDICTRIARWALMLEEYDYAIEHRPGVQMRHVDALSRFPVMVITTNDSFIVRLRRAQETDNELEAVKEVLKDKPYKDFVLENGLLFKIIDGDKLLVVPKAMSTEIIRLVHEDGHLSAAKTTEIFRRSYFITKLKQKVERVLSCCVPCIMSNSKKGRQEGFLHPLDKGDIPLRTYHIDHLGPLESTSKKYKHIFVVVDSFTKFTWLYPTKSTTTREVISKLTQQSEVFGNPEIIISDRGTAFSSNEFDEYCQRENIKHHQITCGVPRSNGQVERVNSIIINVLTKLSIEEPAKWYKHVASVQRVLNSSYQRAIGMSPFELLTGVKIRRAEDKRVQDMISAEARENFEESRDELRQQAKESILRTQEENRRTFNRRRRDARRYRVGDLIAIKRTQLGPGLKLKVKFLGPYAVTKVKPNDTYEVAREGMFEGPGQTTTCAEYMKPWPSGPYESDDEDFDTVGEENDDSAI